MLSCLVKRQPGTFLHPTNKQRNFFFSFQWTRRISFSFIIIFEKESNILYGLEWGWHRKNKRLPNASVGQKKVSVTSASSEGMFSNPGPIQKHIQRTNH